MGILATIDRQIHAATYQENTGWFADWLRQDDGGSDSGVTVNERTAIKNPTVWKCVSWRARMFGMLPKKLFERIEQNGRTGQREATSHPLYDLIHCSPNPTTTSFAWFAQISADLHLWGNSYAYIERGPASGKVMGIWRIRPDLVKIEQCDDGALEYCVRNAKGGDADFTPDEILHIRGLGFDGIQGYSPIRLHMQAIGWNAAAIRYGSQFFKNASRPSFVATTKTAIKDPNAKKALIEALTKSGTEAGRGLLIEGDTDIKSLTMPNDEAQFIETIQHQEENIAGIMEVKPHEIGIMRNMTNNNVEQETISSVTRCLAPLATMVEQWFNLQLLSDMPSTGRGGSSERKRYFVGCELKALLRGDTAAQTAHIEKMFDRGIYSGNDAADYLGLPAYEGGETRFVNRAYGPLDMARDWSMTSQNNPPSAPAKASAPVDLRAQASAAFERLFRDTVARAVNRKKDREGFAADAFTPAIVGLFALAGLEWDAEFAGEYLAALGKRSIGWAESEADAIASAELTRAIDTIFGRSK